MYNVLIFGASGSIGTQTLDVLKRLNEDYKLVAFTIGNRIEYVDKILNDFKDVKAICLKNDEDVELFKNKYPNINFYRGSAGLLDILGDKSINIDIVVNALTGFAGLLPSIKSLSLNKILCLANKESLVVGGEFITKLLREGKGKLYPIDSEHVAIAKCLYNKNKKDIDKILITASGGPFFDTPIDEFKNITVEKALNHPTWKMGKKITIDSSTMMNKAFEIVEAYYLFNVDANKIEPIVDRHSKVHSMVKYKNGDIYLNVGPSDMRIPIYYALTFGKCDKDKFDDVEINTYSNYHFYQMNYEKFPLINYGKYIIQKRGNSGAIINAANEECVYAFLNKGINHNDINSFTEQIVAMYQFIDNPSLDDILRTDHEVRLLVNKLIESK